MTNLEHIRPQNLPHRPRRHHARIVPPLGFPDHRHRRILLAAKCHALHHGHTSRSAVGELLPLLRYRKPWVSNRQLRTSAGGLNHASI